MIILKDNGDGTYLGADETGKLYTGQLNRYGFDEIMRTVISQDSKRVVYEDRIGNTVISSADVAIEGYTEEPHEKVMLETFDDQGEPNGLVEKKIRIIDWTAK